MANKLTNENFAAEAVGFTEQEKETAIEIVNRIRGVETGYQINMTTFCHCHVKSSIEIKKIAFILNKQRGRGTPFYSKINKGGGYDGYFQLYEMYNPENEKFFDTDGLSVIVFRESDATRENIDKAFNYFKNQLISGLKDEMDVIKDNITLAKAIKNDLYKTIEKERK